MTSYSGYILASSNPCDFFVEQFEQRDAEVADGPTIMHGNDRIFGLAQWDEYRLNSPIPLSEEPAGQRSYNYQLFIVRGFAKVIMLAHRRRIVDYALTQVFDRKIFPNLKKVSIFVDRMIEHCCKLDSEFLITSLHGRFAGPGTQLRSISLYGDDVTRSPIYLEHHQLFNFHSSGVGRRLFEGLPRFRSVDDGEIARLANDGFVNLNLTTRSRAQELMELINFVMANRWVEDWVPISKGN